MRPGVEATFRRGDKPPFATRSRDRSNSWGMLDDASPDLRFVVPGSNENRWSDLLASLISTDPTPMGRFVGLAPDRVEREVVVSGDSRAVDRLDLLLIRGDEIIAAIEVKLLSDLGPNQLDRYHVAFPSSRAHFVLHLRQLPFTLPKPWERLSWEDVLAAYAQSQHPWVATTARAWLNQLHSLVPQVTADTVWNDLPDDAPGFELALRSRIAWLYSRMSHWCRIEHELAISSGGGAWVAAMRSRTAVTNHRVIAEVQEGLSAQEWRPDPVRPFSMRVKGPVVLVGLAQIGPDTSSSFDWKLLHHLFRDRVYDGDGAPVDNRPWHKTSAHIRNSADRANWKEIVDNGAPKWLGKGYGMATARTHRICAFGARLGLAPTMSLGAIDQELLKLEELVIDMARSTSERVDPS